MLLSETLPTRGLLFKSLQKIDQRFFLHGAKVKHTVSLFDQACACIFPVPAAGLDGRPGSAHRALGPIVFVEVGIIYCSFSPVDVVVEPETRTYCKSMLIVAKYFETSIIREN